MNEVFILQHCFQDGSHDNIEIFATDEKALNRLRDLIKIDIGELHPPEYVQAEIERAIKYWTYHYEEEGFVQVYEAEVQ